MENLKEKDLDLIIEALDFFPSKKEVGFILGGMITTSIIPDPFLAERILKKQFAESETGKKEMKEKTDVLKGKITELKNKLFPKE